MQDRTTLSPAGTGDAGAGVDARGVAGVPPAAAPSRAANAATGPSPTAGHRVDALVVGAGVVGLACARALAQAGLEVVVVEREARFGQGVSSRSSEVVHAGLHGAPDSLKARLCVRGNALLQAYCDARGVPLQRCGKLVVATRAADAPALRALQARAEGHGVAGLRWLDADAARALEPALHCHAALWSPSSGTVDSHALMTALLADAEAAGALLACRSALVGAGREGEGWQAQVQALDSGGETVALHARWLVNAAGLDAQAVAAALAGFPASQVPRRRLARGHYFALSGRAPFSRLIYPLPVDGGLGVHLTLDGAGRARFGPDVDWFDSDAPGAALDHRVDASRAAVFETAIRRWWPRLPAGALQPDYAGIRPKLSGPGEPAEDFRIDGPARHGVPGVVQLFGIESPGLTACLAIAEQVADLVGTSRPGTRGA